MSNRETLFKMNLQIQESLEAAAVKAGKAFAPYRQYRNDMGLLPDHIRESSAYQAIKAQYNKAHKALGDFNKGFVKEFKKELREERAARRAEKFVK